MAILDAINDRLWPVLDALRIGRVFEKYHIPPILFPIAVIILAALIFLLLPTGGAPPAEPGCGDGTCDSPAGEDIISCPDDCILEGGAAGNVRIEITGRVASEIEVSLNSGEGELIQKRSGSSNSFSFERVSSPTVFAHVRNPDNGKAVDTRPQPVTEDTVIQVALPDDFFTASDTAPSKGTVVMTLKSGDGEPLSGRVSLYLKGSSYTLVSSNRIEGRLSLSVDAGKWYAVTAESSGYMVYDGRGDDFLAEAGEETRVDILLEELTEEQLTQPASLRVCVSDPEGEEVAGAAEVASLTGEAISRMPLSSGCAEFELTAGVPVVISTTGLPLDCVGAREEVTPQEGQSTLALNVSCGEAGRARVMVVGVDGEVLTENASITASYSGGGVIPGTGMAGTLALGEEGYTEFVSIAPMQDFYFTVANLSDYPIYESLDYAVRPLEDRSITLNLTPAPELPVEYEFEFSGISYPNPITVDSPFTLSVSSIYYGDTDVTDSANMSAAIAGNNCSVSKNAGLLAASCVAPPEPGDYELGLIAQYDGAEGTLAVGLSALLTGEPYFELTPHLITDTQSPIELDFDIKFNNTLLDSLDDSKVTVYYDDGDLKVSEPLLTGSNGWYSMSVSTPYPGGHRAEIKLTEVRGQTLYEQNFTVLFTSSAITGLTAASLARPAVLKPSEAFTLYATIKKGSSEVAGLANLYASLKDSSAQMAWDGGLHAYGARFTAPAAEGIYTVQITLNNQPLRTQNIYVVDISKQRSPACAINSCENVLDARACAYDFRERGMYTEPAIISCVEASLFVASDIYLCMSSDAGRGDWKHDCKLDADDAPVMSEVLDKMPSLESLNEYRYCGDMDNDGDVDEEDLTCLENVIAIKWVGDMGGTCSASMKGGFCTDIIGNLAGDLDGDANFDSADIASMGKIASAAAAGVTVTERVREMADMNMDGTVNQEDVDCVRSMAGEATIQSQCLRVYNYGCSKEPGDFNQNGAIDDFDQMVLEWSKDGRIECDTCTDFNGDGLCDELDQLCIAAILAGDEEDELLYCLTCEEYINESGGVVGHLVCNDGLDNDCNGALEEDDGRCYCGPGLGCDRAWDIDSIPSTHGSGDWAFCMYTSWGAPTISGSEAYASGEWGWHRLSRDSLYELEDECTESEHMGRTMYCQDELEKRICFGNCSGEVQWYRENEDVYSDLPIFPIPEDTSQYSCGEALAAIGVTGICCDPSRRPNETSAICPKTTAVGTCPSGYETKVATTYDCAACCYKKAECKFDDPDFIQYFDDQVDCGLRQTSCQDCDNTTAYCIAIQGCTPDPCKTNCMNKVGCQGSSSGGVWT